MRLLVSVTCANEAIAALEGGADFIDAKDPSSGALGAVSIEALREIVDAVAGARQVTAALGEATCEERLERSAERCSAAGVALIKVGFAHAGSDRVADLTLAAVRGARAGGDGRCGVIAVAYADAMRAASPAPDVIIEVASRCGAAGVLIDTADKSGPGLCELLSDAELSALAAMAHRHGLLFALAGKLTAADFPVARQVGADIVGVRGAACEGGRTGQVSSERVRALFSADLSTSTWLASTITGVTPAVSARAK